MNLPYSYQQDQEISNFAQSDSELVNSLIRARTTKEVEITLKEALPSSHANVIGASKGNLDGHKVQFIQLPLNPRI